MLNLKYTQKMKEVREGLGLTQEEVALMIGVSRPTYALIESGKQEISLNEMKILTDKLGIDPDIFVYGEVQNLDKYKQMIIAFLRGKNTHKEDGKVTKTKLAKLLYLADFSYFYDNLKSMSGMQYRKIQHGPVPDLFFKALDELLDEGKIVLEQKDDDVKNFFLISENESNANQKLDLLNQKEEKLIQEISKKWQDKKTGDIVTFTHNQMPYIVCRDNELIPYELITQEDKNNLY